MKEYDERQLFTQIYKTYNLLKNQNPNKFTTHIKSSLVLPKNSSLTCKTFSQILKREHENESKIKQFPKKILKTKKQKPNKIISQNQLWFIVFRPLFIASLRAKIVPIAESNSSISTENSQLTGHVARFHWLLGGVADSWGPR